MRKIFVQENGLPYFNWKSSVSRTQNIFVSNACFYSTGEERSNPVDLVEIQLKLGLNASFCRRKKNTQPLFPQVMMVVRKGI